MSSVNFSTAVHKALYEKSPESERLSTPTSLDEHFKKQVMTQRAKYELEQYGEVSAEVRKYVDVEALKSDMQKSSEGESSAALSMLENVAASGSNAANESAQSDGKLPAHVQEETNKKVAQGKKAIKEQNIAQKEAVNELKRGIKSDAIKALESKTVVDSNAKYSPSKEALEANNPLKVANPESEVAQNSVRFLDEYSQKTVEVPLDKDNYERLSKSMSKKELTDYVKKWYYEAAYGVGYLQHDSNGDGVISKNEAKNLKALVSLNGKGANAYRSLNETLKSDGERDAFLEEFGYINSMAQFINHSIRKDSDNSGTLSFKELVGEKQSAKVAEAIVTGKEMTIFALHRLLLGKDLDPEKLIYAMKQKSEDALLKNKKEEKPAESKIA